MEELFIQKLKEINTSYEKRKSYQQEIWRGFISEVEQLTELVSSEFRKVIDSINLETRVWDVSSEDYKPMPVKIDKFEVVYHPEERNFSIQIGDWAIVENGKKQPFCGYLALEGVIDFGGKTNPKIKEFATEYSISRIFCECSCGSDHN